MPSTVVLLFESSKLVGVSAYSLGVLVEARVEVLNTP